jgi:hypothetical protein
VPVRSRAGRARRRARSPIGGLDERSRVEG